MGRLIRRQKGPITFGAIIALVFFILVGMRLSEPAMATSGGSPYEVPVVTDTNPDPTIVETTIVAAGTTEDIGNGVMANVLTYNGSLPGPEFPAECRRHGHHRNDRGRLLPVVPS